MDISFTSDEEEELYYDTVKAEAKSQSRTLEPPSADHSTYLQLRNRGVSQDACAKRRKRSHSKSVGKRSYDDALSLFSRSDAARSKSRISSTKKQEPAIGGGTDKYLSEYLKQKEEVLKERANRLLQLSQLQS